MKKQYLSMLPTFVILSAMISGSALAYSKESYKQKSYTAKVRDCVQVAAPIAGIAVIANPSLPSQLWNKAQVLSAQAVDASYKAGSALKSAYENQDAVVASAQEYAKIAHKAACKCVTAAQNAVTSTTDSVVALVKDPKAISKLFEPKPVSMWDRTQNAVNSAYYAIVGKPETTSTRVLNSVKAFPGKAWNVTKSGYNELVSKMPPVPESVKVFSGRAHQALSAAVSTTKSGCNELVSKMPSKAELSESVKVLSDKALESGYKAIDTIKANPRTSAAVVLGTVATAYAVKLAYDYYKTPKAFVLQPLSSNNQA